MLQPPNVPLSRLLSWALVHQICRMRGCKRASSCAIVCVLVWNASNVQLGMEVLSLLSVIATIRTHLANEWFLSLSDLSTSVLSYERSTKPSSALSPVRRGASTQESQKDLMIAALFPRHLIIRILISWPRIKCGLMFSVHGPSLRPLLSCDSSSQKVK